jgi:hypothetical protein
VKVNPRGLKQLKIVFSAFAKIQTNDLPCVSVDEHLTFEGMLLFLARIEPTLTTFGPLNRGLCDVHDDNVWASKPFEKMLFSGYSEAPRVHQVVFHPMNEPTDGGSIHPPTAANMKIGSVESRSVAML